MNYRLEECQKVAVKTTIWLISTMHDSSNHEVELYEEVVTDLNGNTPLNSRIS